jgi:hypothetical protein
MRHASTTKIPTEPSLCFEVTPALLAFRRAAGHANRYLNTLLVGLETLRISTPVKPGDLVVSWSLPTSQAEWLETRNFALGATMVAVVDGLDRYMKIISRVQGLSDQSLNDVLNGRPLPNNEKRPTIAVRLQMLCTFYPGVVQSEYVAAMRLLVSWRNQFVHGEDKHPLKLSEKHALTSCAAFFRAEFGGISIVEMVARYECREAPTLSDLSTLIACAQRLTRDMDEHLLQLQRGDDYAVALVAYLIASDPDPVQCLERLFRNGGQQAAGRVHAHLLNHGANHDTNRRASAPTVTRKRLDVLLGVGRNRAAQMFGIKRPKTGPGE